MNTLTRATQWLRRQTEPEPRHKAGDRIEAEQLDTLPAGSVVLVCDDVPKPLLATRLRVPGPALWVIGSGNLFGTDELPGSVFLVVAVGRPRAAIDVTTRGWVR